MTGTHIILNGKLTQERPSDFSPWNRGMLYGDGCFETLKSYGGKFLAWDRHFRRLISALEYLKLDFPFDSDTLKQQVKSLLEANDILQSPAYVRIQCWREGGRGYTSSSSETSWLIQTGLYPESSEQPIHLIVPETRAIPEAALSRKYKLSSALNYILAANEARQQQADDALMLTIDGYISETTIANIFWVNNNTLFTPSKECDLLPGITRGLILEQCSQKGIQVKEGEYKPEELAEADAMFTTNSLQEIRYVGKVDSHHFATTHPMVEEIRTFYQEIKTQMLSE